ncbi:MAG: type II CAAX endopeptidase family protein [Anaerolineales bacterium]
MLRNIFLNSVEVRLRAGWRLLLFLLAVPAIMRLLDLALRPLFGGSLENDTINWVFRGILVVIGVTLIVWIFRRFIDQKSFVSLGLRFDRLAIWDLLAGFVLSGIMVGLVFALLIAFGMLEIEEIGWTSNRFLSILEILLLLFGIGLAVGYSEELGFRGYILQNLGEGIGLVWAIVISCILYGLMHMPNPNSTLLSGVLIAFLGFLRIFGWLRTGQLWLPIGMHAGWNFFQGPIFGFSVSGLESQSLVKHTISGPEWLTGGSFGPEAGLVVVPLVLLALTVMFLWTASRDDTPWNRQRNRDGHSIAAARARISELE